MSYARMFRPSPATITLATMSLLCGILSIVSMNMYKMYRDVQMTSLARVSQSFSRAIVIQSIDTTNQAIIAGYLNPLTGTALRVKFYVLDTTQISARDPIVQDGIVIGYAPAQPKKFGDLAPGAIAYVQFILLSTGTYAASSIVIGDPSLH